MPAILGTTLRKRYEIKIKLAQGGMGAVYKAWDLTLEIPVAVKELFDTRHEAIEQFQREARILARLSSPYLPRVTDYFVEKGQPYLVMDFVDGEDLQFVASKRGGVLSEAEVVPWMLQALDAVAYIHSQDIIHRDIKPSNMKLTPSHQIVLVDFGIAKVGSHAHTGLVAHGCFTPYMAPPEQCTMNGKTGVYTDIYALGATMYNLLTGQYPPEAVSRMMGEDLANPGLFNPALSPNTEHVILKAMEILPQNRFQSATEMKEALRRSPGAQIARAHQPALPPISPQPPVGPQTPDPQAAAGGIFRREIRR